MSGTVKVVKVVSNNGADNGQTTDTDAPDSATVGGQAFGGGEEGGEGGASAGRGAWESLGRMSGTSAEEEDQAEGLLVLSLCLAC
eukprot:2825968-Rhodomonas_salina.1